MRKNVIVLTAAALSLMLLSPAVYADPSFEFDDGKVQMEKGKMMQESTFDDKVAMVEQGKMMGKEGMEMTETGMQMRSGKGKANLQEKGMKMNHCGNLLKKKGEQKEPLTDKDKQKLKKEGEHLEALGKRMLEGGKLMSGQ